jgi:hypothetical protein
MKRLFPWVFALCLAATVAPLWAASHLPAVDAPEHLFLTHVLRALGDPASPYQATYVRHLGLTYVTFYGFVAGLGALVGEEVALKLWLTLVLAGLPLAMLLLLRAFKRSDWLALLACPLVYTDNFYWGLVSFLSSLPLTIVVLAAFVRSLESDVRERRWPLVLAVSLVLLQLTHAAGMIFPAMALPLLLATTRSDRPRRIRTVLAVIPGVALFLAWLLVGVHQDRAYGVAGEPWKAVAPLLDRRSFVFEPLTSRAPHLFELLSNGFWDWADRPPLQLWVVLVFLVAVVALARRAFPGDAHRFDPRPLLLFALALGCFFLLPTDIHGYMYMLANRYAQLAALLVLPLLALPEGRPLQLFAPAAAALAVYAGVNLVVLFARFDREAAAFERVAAALHPEAKILHMVLDPSSAVATHPVYLHYATLAALRADGVPSFSLALDPSFPVNYRPGARPPAPPSEWRPGEASWSRDLPFYDHVLARGDAGRFFAGHEGVFTRAASDGPWSVWRRE